MTCRQEESSRGHRRKRGGPTWLVTICLDAAEFIRFFLDFLGSCGLILNQHRQRGERGPASACGIETETRRSQEAVAGSRLERCCAKQSQLGTLERFTNRGTETTEKLLNHSKTALALPLCLCGEEFCETKPISLTRDTRLSASEKRSYDKSGRQETTTRQSLSGRTGSDEDKGVVQTNPIPVRRAGTWAGRPCYGTARGRGWQMCETNPIRTVRGRSGRGL
jgi:hypothetical protein